MDTLWVKILVTFIVVQWLLGQWLPCIGRLWLNHKIAMKSLVQHQLPPIPISWAKEYQNFFNVKMGPLQQTNKKSKRHRHRHHHHETSSTTLAFAFEANTTRQILSEHSPLAAAAAAASEASIHQRTMIYLTANRFLRSPSKKKNRKRNGPGDDGSVYGFFLSLPRYNWGVLCFIYDKLRW